MLIPFVVLRLAGPVRGEPIDGFTEPYRTIEVASSESGLVEAVAVNEGVRVTQGQIMASLDNTLLKAQLAIAERAAQSRGQLAAARAEQRLRADRLEKIRQLRTKGVTRQEEVDRAEADLEITSAQVLVAEDELAIRQLESEKILAQIETRTIRAPIDGIVSVIHKETGEHVSPADPRLVTLVQLDSLLAIFSMTTEQVLRVQTGQHVTIHCARISQGSGSDFVAVEGIVELIAPVTHAESSTVLVKVKIENSDGQFRSGERCWWDFAGGDSSATRRLSESVPRRAMDAP